MPNQADNLLWKSSCYLTYCTSLSHICHWTTSMQKECPFFCAIPPCNTVSPSSKRIIFISVGNKLSVLASWDISWYKMTKWSYNNNHAKRSHKFLPTLMYVHCIEQSKLYLERWSWVIFFATGKFKNLTSRYCSYGFRSPTIHLEVYFLGCLWIVIIGKCWDRACTTLWSQTRGSESSLEEQQKDDSWRRITKMYNQFLLH